MEHSHWNQAYDRDRSTSLWGEASKVVTKALSAFTRRNSTMVLELPCGDGRNTIHLAQAIPFIIAMDISPKALEFAQQSISKTDDLRCVFMQGDVYSLPFLDNQFDGIFCFDLLGHLRYPHKALKELVRICKVGGCIVGNVFSVGDSTKGIDMYSIGEQEYIYRDMFYFKFYNQSEVKELLNVLPCRVCDISLISWSEPPHDGYREYPHEHESWIFELEKEAI